MVAAAGLPAAAHAGDTVTAQAEDPRAVGGWAFGVRGGVTLGTQARARFGDYPANGLLVGHQGVALGGFGTYYLRSDVQLQIELMMFEKGVDFDNDALHTTVDEGLIYVEMPVLARYSYAVGRRLRAFGFAGPTVGWLLDSKVDELADRRRSFDVGVMVGAGVDVHLGDHLVIFDVRVNQGLVDTLDDDERDVAERNRVAAFLLGFTT